MATFNDVPDYYTPHTFTAPVIIVPDRPAQAHNDVTTAAEPATGALVLLAAVFLSVKFLKMTRKAARL